MTKLPGVNHLDEVRAASEGWVQDCKAGQAHCHDRWCSHSYRPAPQPVNAYTMGRIVQDAGLALEVFRKLL